MITKTRDCLHLNDFTHFEPNLRNTEKGFHLGLKFDLDGDLYPQMFVSIRSETIGYVRKLGQLPYGHQGVPSLHYVPRRDAGVSPVDPGANQKLWQMALPYLRADLRGIKNGGTPRALNPQTPTYVTPAEDLVSETDQGQEWIEGVVSELAPVPVGVDWWNADENGPVGPDGFFRFKPFYGMRVTTEEGKTEETRFSRADIDDAAHEVNVEVHSRLRVKIRELLKKLG